MTAPVTVLGEALIEIVVPCSGQVTEHVGGSLANVALGVARLGHQTTQVTHIGADERGRIANSDLARHRRNRGQVDPSATPSRPGASV